ncbi:MAG: flagellar basal body-associated FliL family protein [Burkholderiaceae bacterium]|uniref:flagellar basal body-associated FliL family protein n=1 Tax=Castellaniella sp. TaxID=1955812 RepID=UPI00355E5E57
MSKLISRLLKFLALAVLAIGISTGTAYLVSDDPWASIRQVMPLSEEPAPEATETQPAIKPLFASLEPFTVTLYGETRNRMLHARISLRLADTDSKETLQDYMPEIRDRTISILSRQDPDALRRAKGHRKLAEELRQELSRPLSDPTRNLDIAEVLFTAFVVQ